MSKQNSLKDSRSIVSNGPVEEPAGQEENDKLDFSFFGAVRRSIESQISHFSNANNSAMALRGGARAPSPINDAPDKPRVNSVMELGGFQLAEVHSRIDR